MQHNRGNRSNGIDTSIASQSNSANSAVGCECILFFLFLFPEQNTQLSHQCNPIDGACLIQVAECLKHNESLTSLTVSLERLFLLIFKQSCFSNKLLQDHEIKDCDGLIRAGLIEVAESLKINHCLTSISIGVEYFHAS